MTNRTKSKFTSHCRIAVKTNFFLLLFPTHFAHARYSSRVIDRFLNCGDLGKLKSGKIKGHCQPPCPMQDEEILLRCVGALCFSECCGNCWNSTVKSIHFVVFNWYIFAVVKIRSRIAHYKYLRYRWFNLWILLEATSTTRLTFTYVSWMCLYR